MQTYKVSSADFTLARQFYGNLEFRQTRKEKGDKREEEEEEEEGWQIRIVIILLSILSL